ncbi:MAG: 2-octaprenyl-3-methyl-6-methoxy-1,4-benzoquinol hydroxylase [Moraxellaceae bacterium]|nr:MAG: 2-octaprenyl-3-methyl-6-methoxy-1,4-benzoquinol hydroxylase [Moraxellaceae bacterium]
MSESKLIESDYDVVIVGGGMVGASVACALLQASETQSLRIAIVEGQAFNFEFAEGFDPRVSAISLASRKLMEVMDVWPKIAQQRLCPYQRMSVWDAEGTGGVDFSALDMGEVALGHIIENRVVLASLLHKIQQFPSLQWYCPNKLEALNRLDDRWLLTLANGLECSAKLIIGADGAHSVVRNLCGIDHSEMPYDHRAVVTTIKTERAHECVARQRFMPKGPLAFLPLLDDGGAEDYCSVVWSLDSDEAEQILGLEDEAFCEAISRASEHCLGEVVSASKRFSFPLIQRHANQYVRPGVALVGDAAHTIHPLAGQGVNLGFMDAAALVEELNRGVQRGLPIGDLSVLRRYERRRRGPNTLMIQSMRGFKELFAADALPVRWVRNFGLSVTDSVTPLKHHFMAHAMGLKGDVPRMARGIKI